MYRVGILGGGQLARMLILAGAPLGLDFTVFTESVSLTTANLAHHASPQDVAAIEAVDVMTYETENISHLLVESINLYTPVFPKPSTLAVTQDRLQEKQLFKQLMVPTNGFHPVNNREDLQNAVAALGFPLLLKTRSNGYDGKYQYPLLNQADIDTLLAENARSPLFLNHTIAEEWVKFDREISVVATRDRVGHTVFYDICENFHQEGILRFTVNNPKDVLESVARYYVQRIMDYFDYVGTIAVEFFVQGETLWANEIAPRVHNSGHWTIEGCVTSQFENHLRAITGLSLGNATSWGDFMMYNIITEWPDRKRLLGINSLALHDYRKTPQRGRKLGHITVALDKLKQNSSIFTSK